MLNFVVVDDLSEEMVWMSAVELTIVGPVMVVFVSVGVMSVFVSTKFINIPLSRYQPPLKSLQHPNTNV